LFQEKPKERSLNVAAVSTYNIDKAYYTNIKKGKDVTLENGSIISNAELTFDPPAPKSYAYCSDTAYDPKIIPLIQQADLLYHEATFLESEAQLARKTKHSTAKEAATIAREAGVKQLLLGHFSTRYRDFSMFAKEAEIVFSNVLLAEDGKEIEF
jgi:ribonuclease Z